MLTESLTIVIPALNEEDAIAGTIGRCLEARRQIKDRAGLEDIEIIVVSDGSTDRTAEIAQGFDEVQVVVFEKNRGYGAAIKEGWLRGKGTLLGFLDADGTCDPLYFAEMCRVSIAESADVVLGSRMGKESRMPRIRRLGNQIYALLLGFLVGRRITDIASGMRVVKRSSLPALYPLPDGLHFTPSMSARALLNHLRVVEIPMTYSDRIGRSKLNVLKDGVLFLKCIFESVLCYKPEKPFLMLFSLCAFIIVILAANPVEFYIRNKVLQEWMIYRFALSYFLGSFCLLLLLSIALANHMSFFSPRRVEANTFWASIIASFLRGGRLLLLEIALLVAGIMFLWPGIAEYVSSRTVHLHWSRLLAGFFSLYSMLQILVFYILMRVVNIWQQQRYEEAQD